MIKTYYRSQGYRYPRDMRIPINYSGSAFSEQDSNTNEILENEADRNEASVSPQSVTDTSDEITETSVDDFSASPEEAPSAPTSILHTLSSGSFLGGRIGSEELLILALVFLLSDTDADNDIIWLLLLLLFIK